MTRPSPPPRPGIAAGEGRPRPPEPHLLRFGLRQLFVGGGALALFCATLKTFTEGALLLAALAVLAGAHVLGAVLGTRLRDSSRQVQQWRASRCGEGDAPAIGEQPLADVRHLLPPPTSLASQAAPLPRLPWVLGGGGAAGGAVGAGLLALILGSEVSWAGLGMGAISCGVLGAWLAFLAVNFAAIARQAWKHAHAVDASRPTHTPSAIAAEKTP